MPNNNSSMTDQNELTSLFDSVLKTDFDFKLSIPHTDSNDQFFSLVQCLKILDNSKQKYIKEFKSKIKKINYGDETYKALSLAIDDDKLRGLDVSKTRAQNLINDHLLVEAQKMTNFGNLMRSQIKTNTFKDYQAIDSALDNFGTITKEMISNVSLIHNKKKTETKKDFHARLKKEMSLRYKESTIFSKLGTEDSRIRLMYFQDKFIPFVYPISQFPLHAMSNKDISLDKFAKMELGPLFFILAKKSFEIHSKLSQEYFDENSFIYQKIDRILRSYHHNQININHSLSLVKLLLKGLDINLNSKISKKINPWDRRRSVLAHRYVSPVRRNINAANREMLWSRLNASFYAIQIKPEKFWDMLKKEFSDLKMEETLFRSFNSFSDGFGRNSLRNKLIAEDQLAKSLMMRIKDHTENLKNGSVTPWLMSELKNYYAKSYTQDNKKRNQIDYFESLPSESLESLCMSLVGGYEEHKEKILKNFKNFRKQEEKLAAKYGRDRDKSVLRRRRESKAIQEWVQNNIPGHLLMYFHKEYDGGSTFKKLLEINNKIKGLNKSKGLKEKEALSSDEYFRLRKYLIYFKRLHLRLQDRYFSDERKKREIKKLGRSIVPRVEMIPEKLFTLEKSYKGAFNKKTIALISELIHIIEQNPVIGIKILKLMEDELQNYPKYIAKKNMPDDVQWLEKYKNSFIKKRFLEQICDYLNEKLESMINTHTYSLADSLSRILLISDGTCPYQGDEDNDTYRKIIYEVKNLTAFFEQYLEGLIQAAPHSERPVNQKLLIWEITNNLRAIEKYFLTLEHSQIGIKNNHEVASASANLKNDFSLEQLFLISKKREKRRALDEKSLQACLDKKLFTKDYQKYNYIHKEIKKKKLKWSTRSQSKSSVKYNNLLKRDCAIRWLKARPGNSRYRDLSYGDWPENIGFYHFSLTHLNNTK
jgi:hypothetical protein